MGSIVLELQHELLQKDCDVLQALRKAHVIAVKLKLTEFDSWIQSELNGYKGNAESVPGYRKMKGELKAKNPVRGWIPAVITGKNSHSLSVVPMCESLSALIEIAQKAQDGYFYYSYPPELSLKICAQANTPTYMEIAVFISTYRIAETVEQVRNCLLEWILKLEEKGIVGENMTFNEMESATAKEMSQQVNYYYGTVIHGNVCDSQIVSGNNNSATYSAAAIVDVVKEIRKSLEEENISGEDMESALELLDEISDKLEQGKKPGIIKSTLIGLKDFVLATGANVTAALITAKIEGLF